MPSYNKISWKIHFRFFYIVIWLQKRLFKYRENGWVCNKVRKNQSRIHDQLAPHTVSSFQTLWKIDENALERLVLYLHSSQELSLKFGDDSVRSKVRVARAIGST